MLYHRSVILRRLFYCSICFGFYMQSLIFDIKISAHDYLRVYQGTAHRVKVRSRDGRSVSLPVRHLQPFLTHDGIHGSFIMAFNGQGQLLSLRRLS